MAGQGGSTMVACSAKHKQLTITIADPEGK